MAPFFPIFSSNNPKFNMTSPGGEHPSGAPDINTTATSGPDAFSADRANFTGGTSGESPFQGSNPVNGTTPFNTTFPSNGAIPLNTTTNPTGSSHNTLPTTLIHATFATTSTPQPLSLRAALPQPTPPPSGTTTTTATISALAATLPISTLLSVPTTTSTPDLQLSHSLPLGYYPWKSWAEMPNTKLILTLLLLTIIGTWVGVGYCAWRRRRVRKYGRKLKENNGMDGKGSGKWHLRWWKNGVIGKAGSRRGDQEVEMI